MYAQKELRTNFCKPDTVQAKDTIVKRSGKKVINCTKCNGKGHVIKEKFIGLVSTKGKRRCSTCNAEYADYICHFHIAMFRIP